MVFALPPAGYPEPADLGLGLDRESGSGQRADGGRGANAGRMANGPRAVEEVLADLDVLTDELVEVAGPDAVAGVGRFAGSCGVVASRLATSAPRLRSLCARLDTVRLTWLPVIENEHPWQSTGARTFATWLARTENVMTMTAKREVRTARALRDHLPTARERALAGELGTDHVRALVDVAPTSQARKDALAAPVQTGDLPALPESVVPAETVEDFVNSGGIDVVDKTHPSTDEDAPDDVTEGVGGVDPAAPAPPEMTPPVMTGEEYLTGMAGACDPSRYRRVLKRFAVVADPDADERGYKQAAEREHLEISPTFGGWHVAGFLTDEHGHQITTALGSMMGAPTPGDDRTPTQRRAQALADLARDALDNGRTGTGAAVRPHVSVTVSLTELVRFTNPPNGTARPTVGVTTDRPGDADREGAPGIPDRPGDATVRGAAFGAVSGAVSGLRPSDLTALTAQPATFTGTRSTGNIIPDGLLRKLLCDADVTRIVFGPDSTAIDVGRSQRTVTGQMRKAVIARDQHCVYPGCDQPPSRCEVHHAITHWADGGHTSVANSALLCWHHHTLVDTTGITMSWKPGLTPDQPGHWQFTSSHGQRIQLPHARAG